jgi:hypothetical protein
LKFNLKNAGGIGLMFQAVTHGYPQTVDSKLSLQYGICELPRARSLVDFTPLAPCSC